MGRDGTGRIAHFDVYLRTAVSVEPKGWAHFDYVKMQDYRWGIFWRRRGGTQGQFRRAQGRGRVAGSARRISPTSPLVASPRGHRARLGRAAAAPGAHLPIALRSAHLFQVNVEEGRHLWAMVYLLHAHSAATARGGGRLLQRRSAMPTIRILGAFNEPRRIGCRSSCSPLTIATGSTSSARLPNQASIRSPARAGSC